MKGLELLDQMRSEGRTFDMVFIDADKKMYKEYLQNIMGILDDETDGNVRMGSEVEVNNIYIYIYAYINGCIYIYTNEM
jgi:hypothetical protein